MLKGKFGRGPRSYTLGLACLLAPLGAHASGFALIEQNASGLGNAFAGSAAMANDASVLFFNPAGLSDLTSPQVVLAGHALNIKSEFSDSGSTLPLAGLGLLPAGRTGDDAGDLIPVPNLYVALPFNESLAFGLGINAPFGLATEYEDPWIGRFQGIKSELETINVNPSLSLRVSEHVALGIGINYQRADAELTNAVLLGPATEGRAKIDVDDAAWGWNVGAMFDVGTGKIGIGYRSKIDYTLEGDTTVTTLTGTTIPTASGATAATISMPDSAYISLAQPVGERWELLADLSWTGWGEIQSLAAVDAATGTPRDILNFGFEDTWRVALGATWRANDAWSVRGGLAWDQSPVKDELRTVRLPDDDRYWVALGAQWRPTERIVVDAGYARLFVDDPGIDLTRAQLGAPASFSSHVIGTYDSTVGIYSAQITYSLR